MYRRDGAGAAWGLALVGVLLLAWPRDAALYAALFATISYTSWSAARWMQTKLARWVRVLLAFGVTAAVVLIHLLAPRGGEPLLLIALSGGSVALLLPAYLAAAWDVLPAKAKGRDIT